MKVIGIIAGLMILAPSTTMAGMVYRVGVESFYESGCVGPCLCRCAITGGYLSGSFVALPLEPEDGFQVFNIPNVRWYMHCLVPDCPATLVWGSGTFRINLEEQVQRLELDLQSEFRPAQRYDSGLVPVHEAFPGVDVEIEWRLDCCIATRLRIKAHPLQLVVGSGLPAHPVEEPGLRAGDSQVPIEVSTWGAIKALYRGRND